MKRSCLTATPLIVFVVTALIAYNSTSPKNYTVAQDHSQSNQVLRPTSVMVEPVDINAALLRMESRITPHSPAPPKKKYSATELDYLIRHHSFPITPGEGFHAYDYGREWARDAPEEMFAWLIGKNRAADFMAEILFEQWASVDYDAALAASLQIPNQTLRAQALMTTLSIRSVTNPNQAKKILAEHAALFTQEIVSSLSFSHDQTQTTWDLIIALPSDNVRVYLQANFLSKYDSENRVPDIWNHASAEQRQEWLDAGFSGSGSRFEGLDESLRTKAETSGNPADANKFIESHGPAWAERDLAAALAWTQTHVKGKSKSETIRQFFHSGIQKDFENTLRVWQQMPESYLKKDIAETLLRAAPEDRKAEAKEVLKIK